MFLYVCVSQEWDFTNIPNIDLTPKGETGGVLKQILRPGTGASPSHGDNVKVHYVGTLTDGTVFDSSRDKKKPFKFDLGQGRVIQAWDAGVASMKIGELARLTCSAKFAYGDAGSPPKIPPGATLYFEVELLGFYHSPSTTDEKLAQSEVLKNEGNECFKGGLYKIALRRYSKATSLIQYLYDAEGDTKKRKDALVISCHLNAAATKIKLRDWKGALSECKEVLDLDVQNVKAVYRQAQAHLGLENFDAVRAAIKRGLDLAPNDVDFHTLQQRLAAAEAEYAKKSKNLFAGIFKGGLGYAPAPKSAPASTPATSAEPQKKAHAPAPNQPSTTPGG